MYDLVMVSSTIAKRKSDKLMTEVELDDGSYFVTRSICKAKSLM